MPVYYATKQAEKEEQSFLEDLNMLSDMMGQFMRIYPYAHVDLRIAVDAEQMAEHFRRKYTYGTNLTFERPKS